MGLYVLLYCVLVATAAFFLFRRRKKVLEISLEELSTIWLRYNDDVAPAMGKPDVMEGLYVTKDEEDSDPGKEEGAVPGEKPVDEKTSEHKTGPERVLTGSVVKLRKSLQPYMEEFKTQGADGLLESLLGELEEYGDCPSVVLDKRDTESLDLCSVGDNLAKVTLKEHTVHVVGKMLKLARGTYSGLEPMIPRVVIAALTHDIGKVPERYDSGLYNTHEHPQVSAARLREMAGEKMDTIPWLPAVLKAVTDHHRPTNDQFTALLKRADRAAREMELLRFSSSFSVKETEKWLDTQGLFDLIEPHVNVLRKGRWKAFSFKGVVFSHPDLIYEMARKLCKEARAIDLTFVYESEKENAIRRAVGILKKKGCVVDVMRQNYYVAKVEVLSPTGRKRFTLVPIKGESFRDMQGIEKRKAGYLESIWDVRFL